MTEKGTNSYVGLRVSVHCYFYTEWVTSRETQSRQQVRLTCDIGYTLSKKRPTPLYFE